MEFPRLTIITHFPNAAPEEVENLITKPITESVGTIKGLEKVSSESLEGVSFVTLQFSWRTRIDFAAMEVREKVDLIRGVLPEDASKPLVSKFDPSQSPIQQIVFFPNNNYDIKNLRDFIKREIKGYLDRVDGVALAQFSGGYQREIQVEIDPQSMYAHSISVNAIQQAVEASNLNYPAGHIEEGSKDILIRTIGEFKNPAEIGNVVVSHNNGIPVRLSSISTIKDDYKERKGLALYNGREAVIVSIFKESGKNTVEVSSAVKNELDRLREIYADSLSMEIVYDEARFVKESIENISGGLVSGGILAFLSLILILRNFQSPIILLTVLPISIVTTFLMMYLNNLTLNVMTLGGLSLGIGMLFDSGNVVLAAIERNMRNGLNNKAASLAGAQEVAGSITSAVLTTIIIFLPIIFLKGIIGVVFGEMALTITYSLLVSLIVSLTLIPMLSSLRSSTKSPKQFKIFKGVEKIEDRMDIGYGRLLNKLIDHPTKIFIILSILFLITIFSASSVDREFIPKVDTGEFKVEVLNEKGSSLDSTTELVKNIQDKILNEQDVKHVISIIGYNEDQLMARSGGEIGTHQATIKVILKQERTKKTKEFIAQMRKNLRFREGITVNFQPEEDMLAKILSPDSRPINLEIEGSDLATLNYIGKEMKRSLMEVKGLTDIKTSMEEKNREYQIGFEDEKLANFGLTHAQLASTLKTAMRGTVISRLRISDQEYDIRLRYRESSRKNKENLHSLMVDLPDGKFVKIDQITAIKEGRGYASIMKIGQARVNKVTANIEGIKQKEAIALVEEHLKRIKLPIGYKVHFGGESENISKSTKELFFSFLFAIALIYMLLASQFESLSIPLVMLLTIPLIFIGIIPALWATNRSFNISSFTGIILLVGIVVDNAALFYEYIEILSPDFNSLKETIIASGKVVLRPIILNNGTTLLGLIPVALEIGEGTEFQSPMAITVISGLAASVFLSLFLIPIVFYYVISWHGKTFHKSK